MRPYQKLAVQNGGLSNTLAYFKATINNNAAVKNFLNVFWINAKSNEMPRYQI